MPAGDRFHQELLPENFYHIYNRGNNRERIFFQERNYEYFLKKYEEYLCGYLDTFSFCLLPNHFHFLVRVRDDLRDLAPGAVSKQFRRFFIAYSQAINIQEGRYGSLFQKNFKRIQISSYAHLVRLTFYIHFNPVRHKLAADFKMYRWSSYRILVCDQASFLKKDEVFDWFGGAEGFIKFHESIQNFEQMDSLLNED